jgi:hypothetical protein
MSDRFGTISINPDPAPPSQRPKRPKTKPVPPSRPRPEKPATGPKKSRRWLILAALPIFLLAIYSAGGFFLAPLLLTQYISNSLQQTANIGLTAGEARFNPFTMRLQLGDVSTRAIDSTHSPMPETTLVHIDHALINLHLIALLRNSIACKSLEIKGLTASLIRYPDKSYNLPSLASENKAKAETDSLARLPLLFSLNNITISDSTISFDDRLAGKKHSIEQIKLDLPSLSNFSFGAKEYIRPHFSANHNNFISRFGFLFTAILPVNFSWYQTHCSHEYQRFSFIAFVKINKPLRRGNAGTIASGVYTGYHAF